MTLPEQTAIHLRSIHFGGNWTTTNLKDVLDDITWKEANFKFDDFNTISTLTFHTSYYVSALLDVLEGKPLTSKDELSFLCPTIKSQTDWLALQNTIWETAEATAKKIERLPIGNLELSFSEEKFGSMYTNIHGIIEHMHYHLGQIVVLKRLIRKVENNEN